MREKEIAEILGEHTGLLQSIQKTLECHTQKLGKIDDRLRQVEIKSARNSLISGAIVSSIISAGLQFLKLKS